MTPKHPMRILCATLASTLLIYGCGGGSGSSNSASNSAPASSTTSYQAAMSIGDLGDLTIDTSKMIYTLTIKESSYGLAGQTITGAITVNPDGSYNVVGTTYGKIFNYDNYAIVPVKIDPADTRFADYFRTHPAITHSFYVPVVSLKKDALLTNVDDIISSGASLEFRSVSMGFTANGSNLNYTSEGSRGTITKVSDTQFTVSSCSNNGQSTQNSNLTAANCRGNLVTTKTYTYDAASGAWIVTPKASGFPNQVIKAYFVKDVSANQVFGVIDTSDPTKTSAHFSMASIVPANTPEPSIDASMRLTSYQLCTSDANCAETGGEWGIYFDPGMTGSSSGSIVNITTHSNGRTCTETFSFNNPVNGYTTAVTTAGNDPCMQPQDRPDIIGFTFGVKLVNGKARGLGVSVGYDPTVTNGPSQKFNIENIVQN